MNLSPETKAKLRKLREDYEAARQAKLISEKEKKANRALYSAEAALKRKRDSAMKDMTYTKYLENRKPITENLAPIGALPKSSKGDYSKSRFQRKNFEESGVMIVGKGFFKDTKKARKTQERVRV